MKKKRFPGENYVEIHLRRFLISGNFIIQELMSLVILWPLFFKAEIEKLFEKFYSKNVAQYTLHANTRCTALPCIRSYAKRNHTRTHSDQQIYTHIKCMRWAYLFQNANQQFVDIMLYAR